MPKPPFRRLRFLAHPVFVCAVVLTLASVPLRAGFVLLGEVPAEGGDPEALVITANHDVVVFDDQSASFLGATVYFLTVEYDELLDSFTFAWAPQSTDVWWESTADSYMAVDRYHDLAYVLAFHSTTNDFAVHWDEMWIYVFGDRSLINAIRYNKTATVRGDLPGGAPEDFRYDPNGLVIKEAHSEGSNNTRLIIDDTVKGNFDVLELDAGGTQLASQTRYSYRERVACEWPDTDPGPSYSCNWLRNVGNSLALESVLQTRPPLDPNPLASADDLYQLDHNYSQTHLRQYRIPHPGSGFLPVEQPEIDLTTLDPFLGNGAEGLALADGTDTLWIATGLQSFQEGWLPLLDTRTHGTTLLHPAYHDAGLLLVDPGNPHRLFLPVYDGFAPQPSLILRELVDGVEVGAVTVMASYTVQDGLAGMAYDPTYGLLYLSIGDAVHVLRDTSVDIRLPEIFADGFEAGNISAWSGGLP